ncbi:MAG TPA: hypothetical protein PKD86_17375, partial [Gemmatales bacterium]|nr:hypothetical protein [Gemmatales bacterium]
VIQAALDIQAKIRQTGTLGAKEFRQRSEPTGPKVLTAAPTDQIVAPGSYVTATRQWEGDTRPEFGEKGVRTSFELPVIQR